MLIEQTLQKLRTMRLSQMAKSLEERVSRPDHRDLSVHELMGLIVDDEYLYRENSRLAARLRGAKFKEREACMENVDYKVTRGFTKQTLLELAQLKWIEKKQKHCLHRPSRRGEELHCPSPWASGLSPGLPGDICAIAEASNRSAPVARRWILRTTFKAL